MANGRFGEAGKDQTPSRMELFRRDEQIALPDGTRIQVLFQLFFDRRVTASYTDGLSQQIVLVLDPHNFTFSLENPTNLSQGLNEIISAKSLITTAYVKFLCADAEEAVAWPKPKERLEGRQPIAHTTIDLSGADHFPIPVEDTVFHRVEIVDERTGLKVYVLFERGSFGLRAAFASGRDYFGVAYLPWDSEKKCFGESAYNSVGNEIIDVGKSRPELPAAINQAFSALPTEVRAKLLGETTPVYAALAMENYRRTFEDIIKIIVSFASNDSEAKMNLFFSYKETAIGVLKRLQPKLGDQELLALLEEEIAKAREAQVTDQTNGQIGAAEAGQSRTILQALS